MREHVRTLIATAVETLPLADPVYEFGSYLVAGQEDRADLRTLFPGRRFVGCDLRPGPGVDRVEDLARLSLPDDVAGTILCVDTLEHVFEARRAVDEMIRVLAPGGVLLVAAPMDFPVHQYPDDYWRMTPTCLERLLAPLESRIVGSMGVESYPHTVFAVGCQAPVSREFLSATGRFIDLYQRRMAHAERQIPWQLRLKRGLTGWLRSKGERRRWREYYSVRFVVETRVRRGEAIEAVRQRGGEPRGVQR